MKCSNQSFNLQISADSLEKRADGVAAYSEGTLVENGQHLLTGEAHAITYYLL